MTMSADNWFPQSSPLKGLAFAVALGLSQVVLSADASPDAGSALRESAPPPRVIPPTFDSAPLPTVPSAQDAVTARGSSFTLRNLHFIGNSVFSHDELHALASDWLGQAVTLADLQTIAQRVTEKYRVAGYPLAQAIVPVQDVTDGRVEISVIEGRLGKVRLEVDPAAPIRISVVERIVSRLRRGEPLRGAELERVMLLISDLPGVESQAALEQSDEAASTDLILSIGPRRRWDLAVDSDNHGSRPTSEYRVGVLGRLNSPLRLGDNLDARFQSGFSGRLAYGRVSYELPVGGYGTRIGVAYSRVEYELGRDFAVLDASGQADVVEASITHPIIRSRARNLFGRFGWQEKRLEDHIGLLNQSADKSIRSIYGGIAYEQRDALFGGGYTSLGLTGSFGRLSLASEAKEADRAVRRTAGNFRRWNYNLSRLNALTMNTNFFFGIVGQLTDKNLDSAEKISLGGPRVVRAYAPSDATVDEGHVANLELRYSLSPELSLQGFYDWGWGTFNRKHDSSDVDNDVSLRGYGLGVFWGAPYEVVLHASVAWRVTNRSNADPDRVPRVYIQVSKSF